MTRRKNKHSDWNGLSNLGCVLNTVDNETAPAFFEDPATEQAWLFYGSDRPGGMGDFDVYASPLSEGHFAGPGILVTAFSSPSRDTRIFIRKDGLEAFITSNRAHGQGSLDIWATTRETPSDEWPQPVDLGVPLNSTYDEGSPGCPKTVQLSTSSRLVPSGDMTTRGISGMRAREAEGLNLFRAPETTSSTRAVSREAAASPTTR